MGRIVEHQRALHRNLDRALCRLGTQRGHYRIGADEQFSAETAADIGRIHPHIVRLDTKDRCQRPFAPVDHLVRRPHRQLVAFPGSNSGKRFHHRMRFVRRGISGIDLHGRAAESPIEIAQGVLHRFAAEAGADFGRAFDAGKIVNAIGGIVLRPDQARCGSGLFERFGHHDGDRLMVVGDVAAAEERRVIVGAGPNRLMFGRRNDRDDPGRPAGIAQLHRPDPALGNRRADDPAIGLTSGDIVPLCRIGRGARHLERPVDTRSGLADQLGAVEQVLSRRSVKFHLISLSRLQGCPQVPVRRAGS